MSFFLQLLISGIMVGAIYGLLALGIVLIYKATKVFNFAHADFLMFSGYIGWMCLVSFRLPFWLAFLMAILISFGLGVVVERLFMRRMIGQPVFSAIVLTIGVAYIVRGVVIAVWAGETKMYPHVFTTDVLNFGPVLILREHVYLFIIAVVAVVILVAFFHRTKAGLDMLATAEGHQVSQSLGINVEHVQSMIWGIAAVSAGIAGVLLASINGVSTAFYYIGLIAFPVVFLAGLESITGVIIAGMIIGVAERLAIGYLDPIMAGFSSVFPFVILVVIILVLPYGLFGLKRIERI